MVPGAAVACCDGRRLHFSGRRGAWRVKLPATHPSETTACRFATARHAVAKRQADARWELLTAQELAQDELQNAAVAVVVDLARRVDADDGGEAGARAVAARCL